LNIIPQKTHLIACQTVWEEMQSFVPEGMSFQEVDMGLHTYPERLRVELQRLIDAVGPERDTILLGFGLCSNAVVGLKSEFQRLVIPRVHDCVPMFLGSRAAFDAQAEAELGTYYLTKGFIEWRNEDFNNVLSYERLDEKYGRKKADRILGMMLKNYTRLALINTGNYGLGNYREVAKEAARRLNLRFEEIQGANDLIRKLVQGPWDEEIIIFTPGETVTEDPFYKA
jgi:Protein of unknown function (DUF1638)